MQNFAGDQYVVAADALNLKIFSGNSYAEFSASDDDAAAVIREQRLIVFYIELLVSGDGHVRQIK